MNQKGSSEASREARSDTKEGQSFVLGLWGVRYQVKDVSRSIDFYTKQLGLKLDMQNLPAFGQIRWQSKTHSQWARCFGFSSDA